MCTLTRRATKKSAIYEHLSTCPYYSHIVDLLNVNNHDINQIRSNTIVLDKACGCWNELLFKEALQIKLHKPTLKTGLKASKELQLF